MFPAHGQAYPGPGYPPAPGYPGPPGYPTAPGYPAAPGYGPAQSYAPSPAQGLVPPSYGCISLNMTDRLRLLHFPPQIINVVRDALKGSWKRGIQDERVYGGAHEFKMKGNPWEAQGNEAAPARIMVTAVLASLYHEGWNLISSTDVSKKSNDKDTFFFRHNSSITPHPSTFFAISFNEDDKLRLIGAPPDVIPVLQNVLAVHKQKEQWKLADVAYEFKLKGYPWKADGEATVATRLMLLQIIEALGTIGFEIYASIDMCTGPSNGDEGDGYVGFGLLYFSELTPTLCVHECANFRADTDTWILRRPKY